MLLVTMSCRRPVRRGQEVRPSSVCTACCSNCALEKGLGTNPSPPASSTSRRSSSKTLAVAARIRTVRSAWRRPEPTHGAESVESRHLQVEDHDVGFPGLELLHGVESVDRAADLVTGALEHHRHDHPVLRRVVGDQDAARPSRCRGASRARRRADAVRLGPTAVTGTVTVNVAPAPSVLRTGCVRSSAPRPLADRQAQTGAALDRRPTSGSARNARRSVERFSGAIPDPCR